MKSPEYMCCIVYMFVLVNLQDERVRKYKVEYLGYNPETCSVELGDLEENFGVPVSIPFLYYVFFLGENYIYHVTLLHVHVVCGMHNYSCYLGNYMYLGETHAF